MCERVELYTGGQHSQPHASNGFVRSPAGRTMDDRSVGSLPMYIMAVRSWVGFTVRIHM